jgi:hypothetical protein
VADLGLGPVPPFAAADVLNDPMDLCHSYLADAFQRLVNLDPELVYRAIQSPSTIQDGDLDVILPRLKLPGANPKELAGALLKQVCRISSVLSDYSLNLTYLFRPDSTSYPLRIPFPRRYPHSIFSLPETLPTTPHSLYQRPQNYIRNY